MGRDITGDMQINDTYLDSPLKSVYWEREIFKDRATKNDPEKIPSPNRNDMMVMLKGCVRCIFASLFLGLNENTCQIKKKFFYFTSKPLFVFEKIKYYNFTFSNLLTSSNFKA